MDHQLIIQRGELMKKELIIFDLDNTLIDFKKCESEALKKTFIHFDIEFDSEIHKSFSKVDRDLWDNKIWNKKVLNVEDIPIKRFEIIFERSNINLKEISKFNEMIYSSEESGNSKPNPKIFEDIIKKLDVDKDSTIVIGDSLNMIF